MPLPLPNLDNLTWEALLEEARLRIPAYAPEWTDFNPSDPGITLVELFAYHVEALMYQVNRVGRAHRHEFLRLVNGPKWNGTGQEELDLASTLDLLRRTERAVTAEDYERIAAEALGPALARVKGISGKNLERGRAISSVAEASGDVSLIVVPAQGGEPSPELVAEVRRVLEGARLLGTRVHVVGPRFVPVAFRFKLVLKRNARPREVIAAAIKRLRDYFSPLPSGDSPGWPFGRDVYVSEVYAVLDGIPGVSYVTKASDPSGHPLDEASTPQGGTRRLRRNSNGDLDAIALDPDELVRVEVDETSFTVERERPV